MKLENNIQNSGTETKHQGSLLELGVIEYLQLEEASAVAPKVGISLAFLVKNVEPEQETLGCTGLDRNIRNH